MVETEKLCCKWQGLVWECLRKSNFKELFKCLEGWVRSGGEVNDGSAKVEWDCKDCCEAYSLMGMGGNLKEDDIRTFRSVGCCRTVHMIRNIEDKVDVQRLGFWLIYYKDIMCSNCNETARQASIESGLMNTIVKMMKKEKEEEDAKFFRDFIKNNEPEVVLGEIKYFEWLEEHRKDPNRKLELISEMRKAGYDGWSPTRREITDYFFNRLGLKTSKIELKKMLVEYVGE